MRTQIDEIAERIYRLSTFVPEIACVPHAWESGVLYEEITGTLFCGDLFTQLGQGPALTTDSIVPAAIVAEDAFEATSLTPETGPTIRRLAALKPRRLAVMHGSAFVGDCAAELGALAGYYETAHAAKLASIRGIGAADLTADEPGARASLARFDPKPS
jgi:hypothetical protein